MINANSNVDIFRDVGPLDSAVHLWQFCLDGQFDHNALLAEILSPDEVARANRFHFARDRRRFIVGRATLRRVLAHYVAVAPADLRFSYGPAGKPALAEPSHAKQIEFNLSHSAQWGLLGVAMARELGVDIEHVQPKDDLPALAKRFFAAAEQIALTQLAPNFRTEGFFACWTRKEAFLKALGAGLHIPLDGFCVSVDPLVPAQLLSTEFRPGEAQRWSIFDVSLAPPAACEFKAALAIEGPLAQLHRFQISADDENEIVNAAFISEDQY